MRSRAMRYIKGVHPESRKIKFTFEGNGFEGSQGESIASALMRAGRIDTRRTPGLGQSRGYYCGMGICWECAVRVDGLGVVRGCTTPLADGMSISFADGSVE